MITLDYSMFFRKDTIYTTLFLIGIVCCTNYLTSTVYFSDDTQKNNNQTDDKDNDNHDNNNNSIQKPDKNKKNEELVNYRKDLVELYNKLSVFETELSDLKEKLTGNFT